MTAVEPLKRTALYQVHKELGARMVAFAGWEMPLFYTSIIEEHKAVREAVGLFDVSHMGELEVRGPQAFHLVDYVTPNAVIRLEPGQVQYSAFLYPHGGFVDDILVHKVSDEHYFICVNAANQDKDYQHLAGFTQFAARVELTSDRYTQLAIQGPRAESTLQKLTGYPLNQLRYYRFVDDKVAGKPARIARTGYTGEDGFEVYIAPEHAVEVWEEVLKAGAEFGIRPCGLGARNTLRLEACMPLYGHEINATVTPAEAGLGRIVKLDKGEFVGRRALIQLQERGLRRKLVGFVMVDQGIAREGYDVYVGDRVVGWVTSGGPSPTLGKNIGLCFLPPEFANPGQKIKIRVRGRLLSAEVVSTPFYKRKRT